MTTLEKIRAEIEQIEPYDLPWTKRTPEHIRDMALEIIDKYAEQEPCDDVIDREYLFKVLDDFCGHDRTATITLDTLADLVYDMSPVRPQEPDEDMMTAYAMGVYAEREQKTGHWIKYPHSEIVVCNQCKGIRRDCRVGYMNYCNRCGARMFEPQESEDKE